MAGLFTMPTPEQVRQQARNEAQQRATLFAQAPAGRAGVLAAGQAGGLFGQAIGEGLGGRLPGEEKAMKFQQVQQRVTQELGDIDVSQPEGFYQMANLTAKYANEAGLPEIAQQAQVAALGVREQFMPKSGQQISLNTVENPYEKALAKGFEDIQKEVPSAIKSLNTAETMLGMLEKPMLTGSTAQLRTTVGAFMKESGLWDDDKDLISNTQTYMATAGKQTAQVIRDFGAGTGLSDADREYANKIAGGDINVDAKALQDINRLNIVAAVNKLSEANRQVMLARLPEERKAQLIVPIPPKYQEIADKYNGTFGSSNLPSVKTKGKPKKPELSAADKQALAWAKANPKDPRSAKILKRLGK